MLVNLTPNQIEIDRRYAIAKEHNFEFVPQCDKQWMEYGDGIYQSSFPFNFPHTEFLEFENDLNMPLIEIFPSYNKSEYGVADTVDQIKEYFKEEIENPNRKFFISMTPVWQDKKNAGKRDGWRWYKWGPYIGKLNPQFEYLDDENFGDDFKYVIVFQINEVLDKQN